MIIAHARDGCVGLAMEYKRRGAASDDVVHAQVGMVWVVTARRSTSEGVEQLRPDEIDCERPGTLGSRWCVRGCKTIHAGSQ